MGMFVNMVDVSEIAFWLANGNLFIMLRAS
jgi:hypothetical protein